MPVDGQRARDALALHDLELHRIAERKVLVTIRPEPALHRLLHQRLINGEHHVRGIHQRTLECRSRLVSAQQPEKERVRSLYARGMSVREIQGHLEELYQIRGRWRTCGLGCAGDVAGVWQRSARRAGEGGTVMHPERRSSAA